jgi:thiol-disulfide isomerase/thioredoxin
MSGSEGPVTIRSTEQFNNLLKSSKVVVVDCTFIGIVIIISLHSIIPQTDRKFHNTDHCWPHPTVYADWCGPCKQIAPHYETLARSLTRPGAITFAKVNSDEHTEISQKYSVSSLPTFLVFRDGKVEKKVQGANPRELTRVVQALVSEVSSLGSGSGSGSGGAWRGADLPKGYSDITDQIESRNLELLNADDDAGPVKVLFESSKPSALEKGKNKPSSPDWVQSGADDQLLLFIPFQSSVKLHTLQVCAAFLGCMASLTVANHGHH